MKTISKKLTLGQKVIVNTGGNDSFAIIDYPTIRKDIHGKERNYYFINDTETYYLCRFTEDIKKCWCGGAIYVKGSYKAEDNTLLRNAQYISAECIRPTL